MPVIKSAKKKLKQDKIRTARNNMVENTLKKLLKKVKKEPTGENVRLAVQATDKAAKNHIIHKNKAAHIKSALAKSIAGNAPKTETKPATKTTKNSLVKKAPKKVTK